jgi:outer membrane cobalamin receptor
MYHLLFLILLASGLNGYSLSGGVFDSETNEPLVNVNITIIGSEIGETTDQQGNFQLDDLSNQNITFSLIGYKLFSKDFTNKDALDSKLKIYLEKEPLQWKAVNVMGLIPSKHSPEVTEIVSSDKIMNTDQETLGTLLGNLHGIEVQSAHDYGRNVNVSIRGSSDFKPGGYNNRVLLLLDGFPVSIPNSGSSDWNAIPFETVKHIEVVRGPASSVYGHNSMGGVINIVTRSSKGLSQWAPEVRFGSYGSRSFSLAYAGDLDKTSFIGSLGHANSNGHRFNSGYEQTRFSMKLNRALPKDQKIQFSYIFCNSFNGQPGFVYPDNPGLISYRESYRLSNYLQFYYKRIIKDYLFSLSLATNHFKTDYRDRDDTPFEEVRDKTNYRDHSYMVRGQLQRFFKGGDNLTFGMEIALDQSSSNVLRNIYEQPEQFTTAGFSQYRRQITKKIEFDMGIRFDSREVTGGEGYSVKTFKALSPKVSLFYEIDPKITTYASYNRGFRAPSISELFLEYESSYGLLLQGNPILKPESLTSIEIGMKYQKKNISLFGNIFYNHYKDMIDFIYTIPVRSVNRDVVKGMGAEIGSNVYLDGIGSNLNFTYSILNLENVNSDIPLLYRPKHKIRVTLVQSLSNFDIRLSTRYSSEQSYEDFLSDDHPIDGNTVIFPLETLPETFISDFSISRMISEYDLSLKVINLFDVNYVLIQHYPMPRRNFELSITKAIK